MPGRLIWMLAAGALGTLARYGLSGLVQRVAGASFPWGTLAVNVAGCLLAGVIWSAAEHRLAISSGTRSIVLVGFFGAFTTFSAYALETGQFLAAGQWARAAGNMLLHNLVGLAALLFGLAVGRTL